MAAAEEAVAWAKEPSPLPHRSNYAQLLEDVLHAVKTTDRGTPIIMSCVGLDVRHWACLSRLLIMDVPALIDRIHPAYNEALDSQAGVAWLQIMFTNITGHRPAVRSWRHAKGACVL